MKLIDGTDALSNNGDLVERKYAVRMRRQIKNEIETGIRIPRVENGKTKVDVET